MKLEVGMYVRTKKGKMFKVNETNIVGKYYYLDIRKEREILKASFNITDLIKIGDILEVFSDLHDLLGNDVFRVRDENHLKHLKHGFNKGYFHLISIVTKEQFEQRAYKIIGDDK